MAALRPLPAAIAGAGAPAEDPLRGIILYAAATILFATADTTAKYLTAFLPIIEIIWIRYAIFVMFAASLVYRTRPSGLALRSPSMQLARGVFLVGSSILFVFGVSRMPISQATSISFVAPMLITILSIPLLGEQVGIRRWAAVVVGLIGVLIVVRPGGGTLGAAALFSLGSAFCWAMALIITRKMATSERPTTTLLISATTGLLLLSLLLPFNFAWPTPFQAALTLLLGSFASLGTARRRPRHWHRFPTASCYGSRSVAIWFLPPFRTVGPCWARRSSSPAVSTPRTANGCGRANAARGEPTRRRAGML
jgi:drug/metabolite transporter (DMT)-like permease